MTALLAAALLSASPAWEHAGSLGATIRDAVPGTHRAAGAAR